MFFTRYAISCFLLLSNLFMHASDNNATTPNNLPFEHGCATNKGSKFMEDIIASHTSTLFPVVGILDGHHCKAPEGMGAYIAKTANTLLGDYAAKNTTPPTKESITALCTFINDKLRLSHFSKAAGTTAALLFLNACTNDVLYAQLGDSICIRSDGKLLLSPHNDASMRCRLTRSLADFNGIGKNSVTPEIAQISLEKDDFLVVVSDGVSEEPLSAKQVAEYVKRRINDGIQLTRIAKETLIIASQINARELNTDDVILTSDFVSALTAQPDSELDNADYKDILKKALDNQSIFIVQKKS